MKTVISSLVTALVMMFCSAAVLGEERPMESWTCSYKEGKGLNDLLAARDFELKQAEKAGIDLGNQFLWSLYKGDRDFDFVWHAPTTAGQHSIRGRIASWLLLRCPKPKHVMTTSLHVAV